MFRYVRYETLTKITVLEIRAVQAKARTEHALQYNTNFPQIKNKQTNMLRSSHSKLNSYSVSAYAMLIIPKEKVTNYVRKEKCSVQRENKTLKKDNCVNM